MSISTLPLSNIVDATVLIQPNAVPPPAFNVPLIVGTSNRIPSTGPGSRVVAFSGGTTILAQMLAYGFLATDPEYLNAQSLLAASSNPYFLSIGGQYAGETALQAAQACRVASSTWYLIHVIGATDADNIALTEWAQTAAPVAQVFWRSYSANCLTGVNDIFSTLKAGNYNRYQGVYATVQTAATTTVSTTSTSPNITLTSATGVVAGQGVSGAGIPAGTTLLSLVGTAGVLSNNATATASGVSTNFNNAPNNAYMAAALMGLAMGLNTGFNNSYFTLTNKALVGMVEEPITQSQYTILTGNNGNVYGLFGGSFPSYQTGITGSGQYFDNILGIDMLVADIQYAGANCLQAYNAVGQNDAGQSIILHAMNAQGCQPSVNRGFLSPGVWEGNTIQFGQAIALQAGTSVPSGFLNVSPSYASLPQKPAKRASVPVYCAVIQTDAVQQIIIAVLVQQ